MPIITVKMLSGRTPEQKRLFIERVAQAAVEALGVPEEAVRIVFDDIAPEDWGVGSRNMAELRPELALNPASG